MPSIASVNESPGHFVNESLCVSPLACTCGCCKCDPERMSPAIWAEPRHTRSRAPDHLRAHRHVLSEKLFRDVLVRERNRADRFDEPVVLLLLGLESAARPLG